MYHIKNGLIFVDTDYYLLTFIGCFNHPVRDGWDCFMGYLKAIDIFGSNRDIPLTHAPCIYGQYFILNDDDATGVFGDFLGLKGGLTVPWHLYRDFTVGSLYVLMAVAMPVLSILVAVVVCLIAQVRILFLLEHP